MGMHSQGSGVITLRSQNQNAGPGAGIRTMPYSWKKMSWHALTLVQIQSIQRVNSFFIALAPLILAKFLIPSRPSKWLKNIPVCALEYFSISLDRPEIPLHCSCKSICFRKHDFLSEPPSVRTGLFSLRNEWLGQAKKGTGTNPLYRFCGGKVKTPHTQYTMPRKESQPWKRQ